MEEEEKTANNRDNPSASIITIWCCNNRNSRREVRTRNEKAHWPAKAIKIAFHYERLKQYILQPECTARTSDGDNKVTRGGDYRSIHNRMASTDELGSH